MTLHDRARQLAARTGRTLSSVLSELGRRGSAQRKRNRTVARIAEERKKAPACYWWQQLD